MRCSCHRCDTYMVHSEGVELGCVCPACGYRCKACLGTDSVVDRASLHNLRFDAALMQDLFSAFDEDDAPPPLDDSPDKWDNTQWED